MITRAEIDPKTVVKEIGQFIVETVISSGLKGAVIGLSGGVDSAVVSAITKRAFDEHGGLTLRGYSMPTSTNAESDKDDAKELAEFLDIPYENIPIQEIMEAFVKSNETFKNSFHGGNAAAAVRLTQLSGEAGEHRGIVLGTGNRDEYFLGYFTKRGDGAADIQPILQLTKRMVYQVGKYLNLPESILTRAPTAGLEPGQTDEADLGFSYDEAELIINGFLNGYNPNEINKITGIALEKIEKAKRLHETTAHKRAAAPFPQVTMDYGNGKAHLTEADSALVIGRFQMVARGHEDMFWQITEHPGIKKIYVGIGSRGNTEDPQHRYLFSFEEVRELMVPLLEQIKAEKGIDYQIEDVPDINNNLEYSSHVEGIFPDITGKTAIVTGDPATVLCFDAKYPIFKPEFRVSIHSSTIRDLIRDNKPYAHLVHDIGAMNRINYEGRLRQYWTEHGNVRLG